MYPAIRVDVKVIRRFINCFPVTVDPAEYSGLISMATGVSTVDDASQNENCTMSVTSAISWGINRCLLLDSFGQTSHALRLAMLLEENFSNFKDDDDYDDHGTGPLSLLKQLHIALQLFLIYTMARLTHK